jgi:hypothetical protein
LKHCGAGKDLDAVSEAWATVSTRNWAMVRAGPLTGAIAPDWSRKWVRSVTYIGSGSIAFQRSVRGVTAMDFANAPGERSISERHWVLPAAAPPSGLDDREGGKQVSADNPFHVEQDHL